MRLIDADAAAEKVMREAMKNTIGDSTEDDIAATTIMIYFARALKDDTYFPTIDQEVLRDETDPDKTT